MSLYIDGGFIDDGILFVEGYNLMWNCIYNEIHYHFHRIKEFEEFIKNNDVHKVIFRDLNEFHDYLIRFCIENKIRIGLSKKCIIKPTSTCHSCKNEYNRKESIKIIFDISYKRINLCPYCFLINKKQSIGKAYLKNSKRDKLNDVP